MVFVVCAICHRRYTDPNQVSSVAVIVPIQTHDGENLVVPGVYPLDRDCRRSVATAEHAAKAAAAKVPVIYQPFTVGTAPPPYGGHGEGPDLCRNCGKPVNTGTGSIDEPCCDKPTPPGGRRAGGAPA